MIDSLTARTGWMGCPCNVLVNKLLYYIVAGRFTGEKFVIGQGLRRDPDCAVRE